MVNNFKIKLNILQEKVKLPSSPLPRVTARTGCAMRREGVFLLLTVVCQTENLGDTVVPPLVGSDSILQGRV